MDRWYIILVVTDDESKCWKAQREFGIKFGKPKSREASQKASVRGKGWIGCSTTRWLKTALRARCGSISWNFELIKSYKLLLVLLLLRGGWRGYGWGCALITRYCTATARARKLARATIARSRHRRENNKTGGLVKITPPALVIRTTATFHRTTQFCGCRFIFVTIQQHCSFWLLALVAISSYLPLRCTRKISSGPSRRE